MSTLTIKWLSMKLCWREAHSEVSHASLYAVLLACLPPPSYGTATWAT